MFVAGLQPRAWVLTCHYDVVNSQGLIMSRAVHKVQSETESELGSGENHAVDTDHANKRLALVIAVLALLLSLAEAMANSAQSDASSAQAEASNTWSFFQAKNVRHQADLLAVQQAQLELPGITDPTQRAAYEKQIAEWNQSAEHYRSDPNATDGKGEGTEELKQRARNAENRRDEMGAKHYHYRFASSAFQIGIVLASAAVLTGFTTRGFLAGGLAALIGLAFMSLGLFAPHLVHLH